MASLAVDPGTYKYNFAPESKLAKGKWVKIYINESGIYELSYDELRQMGFDNPEAVTVHGIGGVQRSLNFTNYMGRNLYEDDPEIVACLHTGDKLLFYGQSVEDCVVNTMADTFHYYRPQKNLYANRGVYLLTDSQPLTDLPVKKVSSKDAAKKVNYGYDYLFHEKDLKYKYKGGGQVFWGEDLVTPGSLPFADEARYVYFEADGLGFNSVRGYYTMDVFIERNEPKASLDLIADGASMSYAINDRASGKVTFKNTRVSVPASGKVNFSINCSAKGNTDNFARLDYWTLTYPKSLSAAVTDPAFSAERIGFQLGKNEIGKIEVPDGCVAWDITSGPASARLEIEDGFAFTEGWDSHVMMVFNPEREQKHPLSNFTPMSNSNLHALQAESYDMAIVTVPYLETYARQIADLHEKHDGYRVAVVTQEQLFNEFNAGVPDPMAYRSFFKMLYQSSGGKFKNALFLGPLYADYRNILGNGAERPEGFISLQHPSIDMEDNPGKMALDYYGCMSDYVVNTVLLQNAPMEIGIGFLPIHSGQEAALAVAKIKDYLETEDYSWMVNESMSISCEGDANVHDNQSTRFAYLLQDLMQRNYDSHFVHSVVWLEGLTPVAGRQAISNSFNDGKLLNVYYGHAANFHIGDIYSPSDFAGLQNNKMGFMFFAGCDLAMPDLNTYGIGTSPVLTARRGLVGAVLSTRAVQSNYNQNICEAFLYGLFTNRDRTPRLESPTVGEAYAYAKDYVINSSETSYMYCGDPALKVPVALRGITLNVEDGAYRSGSLIGVSGMVLDNDGNVDTDFNGYVTIKLMAPARTLIIDTTTSSTHYPIEYDDFRLNAVNLSVNSGRFEAQIPVPDEADSYIAAGEESTKFQIYAGAYNPQSRLGAAGYATVGFLSDSEDVEAAPRDEEAPILAMSYNPDTNMLEISAADNVGILPGIGMGAGIRLSVDGVDIVCADPDATPAATTDYATQVALARFGQGAHTALAVATDMQGNASESRSISFTIDAPAPLSLVANTEAAVEDIEFSLSKAVEGMELVVEDCEGNVILRTDAVGANFNCDLKGVPAGTYSAYVRHNSLRGAKFYSNRVVFSVID